jgi:hypothetical protein
MEASNRNESLDGLDPVFLVAAERVRLPEDIHSKLSAHVREVSETPDRVSYASQLVGQIRQGEQIHATGGLSPLLKAWFCTRGRQYVQRMARINRVRVNPGLQVSFIDSWIVRSLAGDFNPVHSHGGHLSGIVYLEVPPPVADPATMDGKLELVFGQSNDRNLDFLGARTVTPVPGEMLLFPAWLAHAVYPFGGPGVRVSYSFNLLVEAVAWRGPQPA